MWSKVIHCLYRVAEGGAGLAAALDDVRAQASAAIADGARVIILSDRNSDEELAPIPSLLAVAGVHHHLVRERTRTQVGLVVESGDAREVHHMAMLVGCGAAAVNPYLAFESIEDMLDRGVIEGIDRDTALNNYVKAAGKGVLKVMSKMGISTLASYTGAQLFQAVGISEDVLDEYFTGLSCPTGGITLADIAADVAARHALAYLDRPDERAHRELEVGGEYQWRREGEYHLFNPETVFKLQHATRTGQYKIFKEYTRLVDDQSERMASLRGLLKFRAGVRPTGSAGRGRARQRDRQALLDGCDELRLDLRGGPRDAGNCDEPLGRPIELRRRRRERQAIRPRSQWRLAPQRDQAGSLGPIRCHLALPDQLLRHPDQDGAGCKTW